MDSDELKQNIIDNNGIINIRVIANSSLDCIFFENNLLKVKIKAIPENNKANKAIIKLFSKKLNISKTNIKIIKGEKNYLKVLNIIF